MVRALPFVAGLAVLIAQTPNSLDYTKWRLTEVRKAEVALPKERPVMLTFIDGNLSAQACNVMRSSFKIEGGKLVIGPMASTQMACPEPENLDQPLANLLTNARYQINGNQMTLTGEDGGEWVFEKVPMASKNATTKFIYVASETKDCSSGAGKMKCLQIRETKDAPWRLNYNPIRGFEHQVGIEYRLRIKEDVLANPPQDASKYVWYLDMVVEQTVVKP